MSRVILRIDNLSNFSVLYEGELRTSLAAKFNVFDTNNHFVSKSSPLSNQVEINESPIVYHSLSEARLRTYHEAEKYATALKQKLEKNLNSPIKEGMEVPFRKIPLVLRVVAPSLRK